MAEKRTAPKLKVEDDPSTTAYAPASQSEPARARAAQVSDDSAAGEGTDASRSVDTKQTQHRGLAGAVLSLRQWLTQTFPGHENAVLFGFLGFIIAILIFIIGFWRTLFIALVVVVGVAIGQQLDGDPKIINAIRNLIRENRS